MIGLSKARIEINYGGVGQLLRSSETRAFVQQLARERANALGAGYGSDTYQAGTRVIASVYTDTPEAAKDNLQNNTLLKVVSG